MTTGHCLLTLRLSLRFCLHVIHEPLLMLIDELSELGLLLWRQYLYEFRRDARFLYSQLSRGLSLLQSQLTDLGLVEAAAHHQFP